MSHYILVFTSKHDLESKDHLGIGMHVTNSVYDNAKDKTQLRDSVEVLCVGNKLIKSVSKR